MKRNGFSWLLGSIGVLTSAMPMAAQSGSALDLQEPEAPVPQKQEAKIRRRVLLVNVPVTVMNAKGELVSYLNAKDFRVADNGVPQKIMYLDLGPTPLSMVLLVETSSRIEPLLPGMRKTGILFADAVMGPSDEAAVMGFDESVDKLTDFTTNHEAVLSAINKLKCGTERSRLFDAMAAAVDMLSSRLQWPSGGDLPERRLAIIIMSEATDVGSDGRLDAIVRRAQLYNIAVYSVGLPTTLAQLEAPPADVRHSIVPQGIFPQVAMPGIAQVPPTEDIRYGYGNLMNVNMWVLKNVKDQITPHVLQAAGEQTGGRHIATFGPTSMQRALDEIGGELHAQYSLTYEPKGTSQTGYHKIEVQVKREGLKVRARPGYYIAPPKS